MTLKPWLSSRIETWVMRNSHVFGFERIFSSSLADRWSGRSSAQECTGIGHCHIHIVRNWLKVVKFCWGGSSYFHSRVRAAVSNCWPRASAKLCRSWPPHSPDVFFVKVVIVPDDLSRCNLFVFVIYRQNVNNFLVNVCFFLAFLCMHLSANGIVFCKLRRLPSNDLFCWKWCPLCIVRASRYLRDSDSPFLPRLIEECHAGGAPWPDQGVVRWHFSLSFRFRCKR